MWFVLLGPLILTFSRGEKLTKVGFSITLKELCFFSLSGYLRSSCPRRRASRGNKTEIGIDRSASLCLFSILYLTRLDSRLRGNDDPAVLFVKTFP